MGESSRDYDASLRLNSNDNIHVKKCAGKPAVLASEAKTSSLNDCDDHTSTTEENEGTTTITSSNSNLVSAAAATAGTYRDYSQCGLQHQQSRCSHHHEQTSRDHFVCKTMAKSRRKCYKKLPAKLNAILSNPDFDHIISWMPHGRAWKIHDHDKLVNLVLPRYFEHPTLSSFMKQVNAWGFREISVGPDKMSYYHELFLRGMPQLHNQMHRLSADDRKDKKNNKIDEDYEPNLYRFPPLPEVTAPAPAPPNETTTPTLSSRKFQQQHCSKKMYARGSTTSSTETSPLTIPGLSSPSSPLHITTGCTTPPVTSIGQSAIVHHQTLKGKQKQKQKQQQQAHVAAAAAAKAASTASILAAGRRQCQQQGLSESQLLRYAAQNAAVSDPYQIAEREACYAEFLQQRLQLRQQNKLLHCSENNAAAAANHHHHLLLQQPPTARISPTLMMLRNQNILSSSTLAQAAVAEEDFHRRQLLLRESLINEEKATLMKKLQLQQDQQQSQLLQQQQQQQKQLHQRLSGTGGVAAPFSLSGNTTTTNNNKANKRGKKNWLPPLGPPSRDNTSNQSSPLLLSSSSQPIGSWMTGNPEAFASGMMDGADDFL